ncbi:hypothetical protein HUJ04_013439 [Dendroctonus ponderosae]|nr:hypothetical protein HUJ04_013439 [Dendroctonus ponderosae]
MDIKTLLKQARAALKAKDFAAALKVSKSIVKQDKNSYMGLVFLGLALQEVGPTHQALKAFQKAIDLDAANPLAWQGLISYHEKLNSDSSQTELLKLYKAYLAIETNEAKLLEYAKRLLGLNGQGDALETCKVLLSTANKCSTEARVEIAKLVAHHLESGVETKLLDLYEACLELLLPSAAVSEGFYSSYITVLNKSRQMLRVLEHSQKMHELFPSSVVALSWICKVFNEMSIEENSEVDSITPKIGGFTAKLLNLEPANAMALFTQAVLLFRDRNVFEAREKLLLVTKQRQGLVYAWVLLTDVLIRLRLSSEALASLARSQKLVRSLTNPVLLHKVRIQHLEILSLSDNVDDWQKCLDIAAEDVDQNQCLEPLIRASVNLQEFSLAEKHISALESLKPEAAHAFKIRLYRKQGKYTAAQQLIEEFTCNSTDWWIEVGLLHWEMGQFSKCLDPFLKAAKCDPSNFACFVHLGQYYNRVGHLDKARRCYEKAFKLNPASPEAGSELSKVYRKLKNWESNLSLLLNLTEGLVDSANVWAWLQLGLTYLEQGNPVNALEYLRIVIRIDPENTNCWESLGDAYFAKGAFTSALKCYQKALDLSEFSLYSALQVAYIKKVLGDYVEAQADFEAILTRSNQYVPALKGLSETCLCQARECLKNQRLGAARDFVQDAVNKVTLAITQRSELTCLWKLLADCVMFVAQLPEKYSCLKLPHLPASGSPQKSAILEQTELFEWATKFYCKAVSSAEDNPFLWHDLGTCYLQYACNHNDPVKKNELLNNAISIAQHCTSLNPEYWQHWNLLGVAAVLREPPNYALAQHSFIKAVIAESNSAVAWTNLGILYLRMEDLELANKAFGEGQRSDPNYVNCWIGQAIIAEAMGHSDAMGLFRHSTQLQQHQEGSLGYGHWVCDSLINRKCNDKSWEYNINNMHAIPAAFDNVLWFTEKSPDSSCAWNMLGLLAERMGLLGSAKKAFKHALVLAERAHKDLARTNYGRLLYRTGEYEEAIEMFSHVEAATFSSGAGFALALFRNGQYEESYAAYEQALHWLTEEQTSQSELLVALASMAYKFQGADAAKTLLFQSIGLNPPSPWSLYATFALSLLQKDWKLSQLVLKELVALETSSFGLNHNQPEFIYHYATLLSQFYLLKNDRKEALAGLSRLVHKYPNIGSTWLSLSQMILRLEVDKGRLQAGANCANIALKLGQRNMDASKVQCLAALSFQRAGDWKRAALFAQKAIHLCPDQADGWATLIRPLQSLQAGELCQKLPGYFARVECNETIRSWVQKVV